MSEEQIESFIKKMNINCDAHVLKEFFGNMKNATDEEMEMFKEQFKKGKIKFSSFGKGPYEKYEEELKEVDKLINDNQYDKATASVQDILAKFKEEKVEENKKEAYNKTLGNIYDKATLIKFKQEDYDTVIALCLDYSKEVTKFSIYNRMGVAYFKKGRHVKARDAFNKAKELFPKEDDPIADKYLKMALEEIENY